MRDAPRAPGGAPQAAAPAALLPALHGAGAHHGRADAGGHRLRPGRAGARPVRDRPRHHRARQGRAGAVGGRLRGHRPGRLAGRLLPDLPLELGRRAGAAGPAHRHLPPPDAPRAGLPRAHPHRAHRQPPDQRHRGARPARDRRRHLAGGQRAHLPRRGGDPVHLRRRAGPADLRDLPAAGHRDRALPRLLDPGLPAHPRARRRRALHAAGDPLGHPRGAGLRPRGAHQEALPRGQRGVPRGQHVHDPPLGDLLPGGRVPVGHRDRDHPVLRRHPGARPGHEHRRDGGLHRLPVELLRPDPAALAALQHLPVGHGGPGEDLRGARHPARADRRPRRACPCRASWATWSCAT